MQKLLRILLPLAAVLAIVTSVWAVVSLATVQTKPPAAETQKEPELQAETQTPEATTASEIEEAIPDVSPTQNTNPFGDSYKNPFK